MQSAVRLATQEKGLTKGRATTAGTTGVGVRDMEPGALEPVLVVEGRSFDVLDGTRVNDNFDLAEFAYDVVVGNLRVKKHVIGEA